jgi:hypothetical protein
LIRSFSGTTGTLGVLALIGIVMPQPGSAPTSLAPAVVLIGVACVFPILLVAIAAIEFSGREPQENAMTCSFLPDGLQRVSAGSRLTIPWTAFTRVRETRSVFLFYQQQAHFLILPRRALGEEQAQRLRSLVVRVLGRHAEVLPETAFSPAGRAWSRTVNGLGYGVVLWVFSLVLESRHGTFIPAAMSSAPVGLLGAPLALLATPPIWAVLAAFAGSIRSRKLALGLLSLHALTALWLVTRSAMADWDQFRRAFHETPAGVLTWIALYGAGQAVLWWRALTRSA